MTAIKDFYWRLFNDESKEFHVWFPSRTDYERFRVALCKYNKKARDAFAAEDSDSICSRFEKESNQGIFWLGQKRNFSKVQFTIIEDPSEPDVSPSVEINRDIGESGESGTERLSEFEKIFGRDPAGENNGECSEESIGIASIWTVET